MNWEGITNFARTEFVCHHCGHEEMQRPFVEKLDALRRSVQRPLVILSGYRCPLHNNVVSETGLDGPHTQGLAADIACNGPAAWAILAAAMAMEFQGIGVKQKGEMGARFLHLDMCSVLRPRVWSY
jgi:uncharacterized protein YcbK (DUF882 family)